MNRAHKARLAELTEKIDRMPFEELPPYEQEMVTVLNKIFEHSNKGIKGRGVGNKYDNQKDSPNGYASSSSSSSSYINSPCASNMSRDSRQFSVSSASSDGSQFISNHGLPSMLSHVNSLPTHVFATPSYHNHISLSDGTVLRSML